MAKKIKDLTKKNNGERITLADVSDIVEEIKKEKKKPDPVNSFVLLRAKISALVNGKR